jgi:alkanesulfonate monooxygenase SsuD/methylene tetrahydromethanopterin reductase-like flavin-dependent oxidoreductase (luciferase family)
VQFAVGLANTGSYSDPLTAIRVAAAAEKAGWDGFFVWDHLAFVWGPPAADPWIVLAAIAATVPRLRIGTAVTPVARRRPHVLAQTVATLDVLSGGRVVFGAGLGGSATEFARFGEPADPSVRAEMLDEGLTVLRALWSGDEVRHAGSHYTVDGVRLAPVPLQPRLPIWIGGNRPASLRRAARWDGWIADSADPTGLTSSPDDVARNIQTIGRGDDFDVAVLGRSDDIDPSAYRNVGASWWLESIDDRRGDAERMLALVRAGPPR